MLIEKACVQEYCFVLHCLVIVCCDLAVAVTRVYVMVAVEEARMHTSLFCVSSHNNTLCDPLCVYVKTIFGNECSLSHQGFPM